MTQGLNRQEATLSTACVPLGLKASFLHKLKAVMGVAVGSLSQIRPMRSRTGQAIQRPDLTQSSLKCRPAQRSAL